MSGGCDTYGLEDSGGCNCYSYELEKRISFLEEELHKLTLIVKAISNHVMKDDKTIK